MSATITTATIPSGLPIVQLTISNCNQSITIYPASIEDALNSIDQLGITEIEYDHIIDTRLLHPSIAA
jgi:hypothetical protein